jgi:hypothetical protein
MALSQESIQKLVELIEACLMEKTSPCTLEEIGDLRVCRHELLKEWRRQTENQFKKRACLFSRRHKLLSRKKAQEAESLP